MRRKPKPLEANILAVDLGNLHLELRDHPKWVRHWCRREADAKRDLAQAKDRLELVEAEVSLKVRRLPDKYLRGVKPTEDSVKACVKTQRAYQEAQQELIQAKHRADVIHAMVEALNHKKSSLENEVSLHGRGYWADNFKFRNEKEREEMYERAKRSMLKQARSE